MVTRRPLATVLTNLSGALADRHRHDEALAAADEAVELRRGLATPGDQGQTALATALNNRSIRHRERNDLGRALADIDEAIAILRPLSQSSTTNSHELAAALINRGFALASMGDPRRLDEAVAATEEAVELRRRLVDSNPEAHEARLAEALNNLSIEFSRLARREALRPEVGPDTGIRDGSGYFPAPAGALFGPVSALFARARIVVEEAIEIQRRLPHVSRQAYSPALARSLTTIALLCIDQNRPAEAERPMAESLSIRRDLIKANQDVYSMDLSTALMNYSLVCSKQTPPNNKASLDSLEECISIRRRLASTQPLVYDRRLSSALQSYAIALDRVGRPREAEQVREEARVLAR